MLPETVALFIAAKDPIRMTLEEPAAFNNG